MEQVGFEIRIEGRGEKEIDEKEGQRGKWGIVRKGKGEEREERRITLSMIGFC